MLDMNCTCDRLDLYVIVSRLRIESGLRMSSRHVTERATGLSSKVRASALPRLIFYEMCTR